MTSYRLKLIAIITMTIDHLGKVFGQFTLMQLFPNAPMAVTYHAVNISQWIGRLAFPLFAFMIAEGCAKTRSMPKYIGRLALFAVISQPFYHAAFHAYGSSGWELWKEALLTIPRLQFNNVFVTLLMGALAIWAYQWLRARKSKHFLWLMIPVLFATCLLASMKHADYEAGGVLLIFALYALPLKKWRAVTLVAWAAGFYLLFNAWNGSTLRWLTTDISMIISYTAPFIFSALTAAVILLYNGERGRRWKWVFYVFYPAHLLVFAAVRMLALG